MKNIPVNTVEFFEPWKGAPCLKINGEVFFISKSDATTFDDKPLYGVYVALEYNPSDRFYLYALTIKGLIGRIKKHKMKLVKGK